MKARRVKGCAVLGFGVFLALQLVPVAWPKRAPGEEIPAPPRVREILRQHCYDCHSSSKEPPWYGRIAPISWLVSYDMRQGLTRLDFSNWGRESDESARYKIAHSAHRIRQGSVRAGDAFMPPASYVWAHHSAALSESETEELMEWAGRHGMALDGSHQKLRLHVPSGPTQDWPYLLAARTIKVDERSVLTGVRKQSLQFQAPRVNDFDPGASSHTPAGGYVTGLNRFQGSYRKGTDLKQALLYVEGDVDTEISGSGAVVVDGPCTLKLADKACRLFVLASGPITLEGGGPQCRLAVVSAHTLSMRNLTAKGVFLSEEMSVKNSSLTADPDMAQATVSLGPARRTVLTYCDRDGELTENDRRLEVLYDAGTFTLYDPEFQVVRTAGSYEEAGTASKELLELDPHMNLDKWARLGFRTQWMETFEKMPSNEKLRARLKYSLWEWVD